MPTTAIAPSRAPICSTLTVLPDPLARTALAWAGDPHGVPADIRDLRCTLQHHTTGHHYAMVNAVADNSAVWTRWPHDGTPDSLLVLPDCPATHPEHGHCCEYEGHPGGHTWQLHDPWNPTTSR
ncbi:hypothetical protein [Actinacidiphila acididurans]|uniref:Uncharacterized protein n=1 Tax=Actinacidiphila acididurans TaxID=2784346 RepID=A0ABS2TYC0_9ACTN|nr:hypothetical protein [Actinacidiphila acididurans]MBM9508077.1 hypothetical protein [Actinacidiphila acididurans]